MITGAEIPVEHVPAKPGEMPAVIIDISAARALGYQPTYDLKSGIATVWPEFSETASDIPQSCARSEVADHEAIDAAAVEAFASQYGARATTLPPLAIVIAAYNEEGAIGPVIEALPSIVSGLATVAKIVVSDGSADSTVKEAGSRRRAGLRRAGQPGPGRRAAARLPAGPRGRRAATSSPPTPTASTTRPRSRRCWRRSWPARPTS